MPIAAGKLLPRLRLPQAHIVPAAPRVQFPLIPSSGASRISRDGPFDMLRMRVSAGRRRAQKPALQGRRTPDTSRYDASGRGPEPIAGPYTSGHGQEPIAGPYPPSPRTPIRGPSLNVEAHIAGRYRADALGSAPFAPFRQVKRAGDGPRIGVRGDDTKTQSSYEAEVEPAGMRYVSPVGPRAGASLRRCLCGARPRPRGPGRCKREAGRHSP